MKTGMTLENLAKELTRQQHSKRDFLTDSSHLRMDAPGGWTSPDAEHKKAPMLVMGKNGRQETMGINPLGHTQLATKLGIPKRYYDHLLDKHPGLLADNVNALMRREPQNLMVRTLDQNARAFLSDRYRTIDNYDMANALLPVLLKYQEAGNLQVVSSQVTDTRLYIKVVFPEITGEIKVGDPVRAGLVLSNSEVGMGSFRIENLIEILRCLNGMVSAESLKKYHVGRKREFEELDAAVEVYSDATKELDDRALFAKASDVIRACFDPALFQKRIESYQAKASREVKHEPMEFAEITAKKFQLNQTEKTDFLKHYLQYGDHTAYGVMNGLTSLAQAEFIDYDRSVELERIGGRILDMPASEWKQLAA
jgi:hypothetical protein